jgi:hypothetical protein
MSNRDRSRHAILLGWSILATVLAVISLAGPARLRVAQAAEADVIKDRIEIQEKLLYAYAYAYDSKDCASWANLFTTDGIMETFVSSVKGSLKGRDAIREGCIARQKNVVGNIRTHHNMMNIVFDQLTSRRAETRTYCILTWQKPDAAISVQDSFVYKDVIVKSDDGKWLFKERKAINLAAGLGAPSLTPGR